MNSAKVSVSRGPLCLRLLLVRGASSSQKSNACDASGAEGCSVLGAVGEGVCTGCLRNGRSSRSKFSYSTYLRVAKYSALILIRCRSCRTSRHHARAAPEESASALPMQKSCLGLAQKTGVSSPTGEQGFNDVKVVNGVKDNQEFLHEPHDFFYNNEALTRKTVVVNGVTRI